MTAAQYDIFKKHHSELVWIESARDLPTAKARIEQLARQTQSQYVVYDQRAKRIVVTSDHGHGATEV